MNFFFFHSFLLLLLLPTPSTLVYGWGTLGHEIVANIAWNRIRSETQQWIIDILGNDTTTNNIHNANDDEDPGSPLAAIADWADRVRHYKPWSGPLHYIDVRDDLYDGGCHYHNNNNDNDNDDNNQCHFDYQRDCPDDICVAGAIVNYTSQLLTMATRTTNDNKNIKLPSLRQSIKNIKNNDKNFHNGNNNDDDDDIWKTREALKFVTHFIGDIHQPLHCSRTTDKGGNDFHVHFNFNLSEAKSSSRQRQRGLDYHLMQSSSTTTTSSSSSHVRRSSPHHSWNLHSVWDTGIIEVVMIREYQNSRTVMEMDLFHQSQTNTTMEALYLNCSMGHNVNCTMDWGEESFQLALQYAYRLAEEEEDKQGGKDKNDNDDDEVKDGSTLTELYYETRVPIVKDRLIAAGIRLGATLDAIYNATISTTTTTITQQTITDTTISSSSQEQEQQTPESTNVFFWIFFRIYHAMSGLLSMICTYLFK